MTPRDSIFAVKFMRIRSGSLSLERHGLVRLDILPAERASLCALKVVIESA